MSNVVVAVVGMCGSGKSEATAIFLKNKFSKVYFGDVTFDEMKKRSLAINPDNERMIREELRKSGDNAIYAKLCLPRIEDVYQKGNVLIESMYSWSEYKFIKEKYGSKFFVVAIVTNKAIREQRLSSREIRPLTKAEVDMRDYTEIENIEKGGPIGIADYYVLNNGSMAELETEVQKIVDIIKAKNE